MDGQLEKLGFLRQAISNLLLSLLSNPDDERVKCAAQLLKVSPSFLKFFGLFSHIVYLR